MTVLGAAAFMTAGAAALWILAGYPLVLRLLPRRPWSRSDWTPRVSVVIPTYCEYEELGAKLGSVASLDYPSELLEIIVVSDGDPVLARVAAAACSRATVLVQPERRGKTAALNRGLAVASGEIVLLTDADNPLDSGSLRAAVSNFADPDVWAVVGRLPGNGSAYEAYEDRVRRLESRSGSVSGASAGFMAARRDRLGRLPEGIVNDDTWLVCDIARRGGRLVYEPLAMSSEPEFSGAGEHERRARMAAGRTALAGELRGLPPGFAWRLVSHKLGRLALPFLLTVCLVSSAALAIAQGDAWSGIAGMQIVAYGAGAVAAAGVTPPGPVGRAAGAARQFLIGNWAIGAGVVRALRSRQAATWRRPL
jgi:hypothetical protein